MGIKSSWPGPENSTPINSRAISEFNTHNPTPIHTKFIYENDFRVRIKHINYLLDEIEANDLKKNGSDLTIQMKELKEYFNSCKELDEFTLSKIVNNLIDRLNGLTSTHGFSDRVVGLKDYFRKDLVNHKQPSICDKARKIKM